MARSGPVNRVDQALQIARDALDVANQAALREQTHRFLLTSMLAALRDNGVVSPSVVDRIFVGTAAIMDKVELSDEAGRRTLAASREYLAELASNLGSQIPPKGQAGLPRRL